MSAATLLRRCRVSAADLPTIGMSARWRGDALTGSDGDPITTWLGDVSSLNIGQATTAAKPTVKRGIVNGHDVARFDGGDFLTGANLSTFLTAAAGTVYVVAKITSISTTSGTPYDDVALWADASGYLGQHLRSSSGSKAVAYNYSGGNTEIVHAVALGAVHVISWRHVGGNLYCTVNGVTGSAISSNNTDASGLGAALRVGTNYSAAAFFVGDIADIIPYNVGHDATTEATAHAALMATYGIT